MAKDRATKEGIVVNPPELGNLPGQGEVTYARQIQAVLIPYTTREDIYNYYEERNYYKKVIKFDGRIISCAIFRNISTIVKRIFSAVFHFITK